MANLQYDNASYYKRITVGTVQTAQNIRISAKTDVSKVLTCDVDSYVTNYEITNGGVSFFGKTNIRSLYGDGEEIHSFNYVADFADRLDSDAVDEQSKLKFEVKVLDVTTTPNANTVTVGVLLEVTVTAFVAEQTSLLTGGDAYCNSQSKQLCSNVSISEHNFAVSKQLVASSNVSTALLAESSLCVTDYTADNNVLHLFGQATVRLTYLSDGQLVCDELPFDFDEEVEITSLGGSACVELYARNTRIRLEVGEEESTALSVDISATAVLTQGTSAQMDVVDDLYGSECDYACNKTNITSTLMCDGTTNYRTLSQDVEKDGIITGCYAYVTKCSVLGTTAVIDGVATCMLVSDGDGYTVDVPFSEKFELPTCNADEVTATACVKQAQCQGGKLICQLCVTLCCYNNSSFSVITGCEEVAFDKTDLPAIEVCLAHKGETLWQLGKSLHMSTEQLVAINPEVTNPLESDTKIIIYNKI